MEQSLQMGSSCSTAQESQGSTRRGRLPGRGDNDEEPCILSSPRRKLLRFSVAEPLPDNSIALLYPRRDNTIVVGTNSFNTLPIRSPKTLFELCMDSLCRSLPYLDGELPRGLPQDVVEDIVHSLYDHAALNASTLRCLRNCELASLSLAGCRGVTDAWLAALGCDNDESSMEIETKKEEDQFALHDESSIGSASSFLSADQEPSEVVARSNMDDCEADEYMDTSQHDYDYTLANQQVAGSVTTPVFAESLLSLSLRGCQFVTDDGLLRLGDLYSLREVDFSGCQSITGKGLLVLSEAFDLTWLSLANCRRFGDEGIVQISHLDSLKHLDLSGCRCISDQTLAAVAHFHTLRFLDLSLCDQITDDGLSNLGTLEMLNELRLGWCRLVSDVGLKRFAEQSGRSRLQVLHLPRVPITDEGLVSLAILISLEELDITGCLQLSGSAVGNLLSHLHQMTNLVAAHCPAILRSSWQGKINRLRSLDLTYANVKDAHLLRLTNLSSLEELKLGCCPVGASAIAHLAENLVTPNLRVLDLADTQVSDQSMPHIASFTKLEHLSLFSCSISNRSLRHLGKLVELQSLDIDCRDVTDDGLLHLRELKKLKKLELFSGRFTDSGCYYIANLTSLESLDLCGGAISDMGCCRLASGLGNLRHLNLSQNERITNRGAAALATLLNLESLNLSNTRVDSQGLNVFSDLRKLKSLTLFGCRIINPHHITNLRNCLPILRCWRLDSVDEKDGIVKTLYETTTSIEDDGSIFHSD